jgi:hypothetical protein
MSERYEVLAVRYGTRHASAAEVFLNYHVYHEEMERDRPFSIVASLADMYAAFDQIRELADGGARVVASHDPLVAERFGHPADPPGVITISR